MKTKLMTMLLAAGAMLGAWAANVRLYVSAPSAVAWGDNWYCYAWEDGVQLLGGWPGTKTVKTETRDGVTWHYWDVTVNSDFCLILNDGSGKQTGDFAVTGVSDGKAYFIEVAKSGGNHSCQIVNVGVVASTHNKVQLWENGPYWAETNIGADEPWDSGYYFWWGDTVGYRREGTKWVASDESSSDFQFGIDPLSLQTKEKTLATLQSEGWTDEDGYLATEHDAAHVHWGGEWSMPTDQDFNGLVNNCDWTFTTTNGVNGYIVRGRGEYSANSIFLPACGNGNNTGPYAVDGIFEPGHVAHYWSCVTTANGVSTKLFYGTPDSEWNYIVVNNEVSSRDMGYSIRPVQEQPVMLAFDLNYEGGETVEGAVPLGRKILPFAPTPVRDGWTFVGWFTAPEGGEKISESDLAEDGATYYAHWVERGNLSVLTTDYEAQDGDTITGTLAGFCKISIVDGATVTLSNAVINCGGGYDHAWAGITCDGDATIILNGENVVSAFHAYYPGIFVPAGKTLTIKGDGTLEASACSDGYGAGIGGGYAIGDSGHVVIEGGRIIANGGMYAAGIGCAYESTCGDITISGGTVVATGSYEYAAGIGCSYQSTCGAITISGGTVTATGSYYGAGIGGGYYSVNGNITITGGVVVATGSEYAAGIGGGCDSTCGDITIGPGFLKVIATKEGYYATYPIGCGSGGTGGAVTVAEGLYDVTEGYTRTIMHMWTSGDCSVMFDKETGTLAVSGTGAMADYDNPDGVPWRDIQGDINIVVVKNGVTAIGDHAFDNCAALTDIYCYPYAAALSWGLSDLGDGSVTVHVKEPQLEAYQAKFGESVAATFVGDLPEFEFTTDGDVLWTLQGDGSWYSGRIPGSNGDNWLTTTVTGPGILSFDWKIQGAGVNSVYIECYVDDERVGENYGEGWQTFTHELGEGEHSVVLYYCEDGDPSLPGGAWMKNFRLIQNSVTPDVTITEGAYFKKTLVELGYDVPNDGATAYNVVAYGLPAGLKLKYNAAVTKKVKKGKKTTTVVVTPAKTEWWIEGVPTAALDYATNPPYLVITTNGVAQTLPLSLGVEAQDVTVLDDLMLGDSLNEQFYLPGVTNGWTVSGLPTGLKYTAKLVTTVKKKGKKIVSVTTNALPYSVYGKTTKAGLFTVTAKKKAGAYNETLKFRVLVNPAPMDTAIFGDELTNIVTMAYEKVDWDLTGDGGRLGEAALPGVAAVGGKVAKVAGLPGGVTFAASDTYGYANAKKKTGKYLKQAGQTIVGTPTKPGTYVVTFTKNVKSGKKTVAKTAQILWVVEPNDAELDLAFNNAGGVIESGSVGLKYGDLMAFTVTSNATVKASGLPAGIKLAKLDAGDGGALGERALPGFVTYGFTGFTTKAGTYLVTVTATLNGKSVTQRIALKVEGLPAWAKGTFNGVVSRTGGSPVQGGDANAQAARSTSGLATITVSSAGKISGKFQEDGTNWTFSAACYTGNGEWGTGNGEQVTEFTCSNVVAKYAYKVKSGKKTVTKYLTRTFQMAVTPVPIVPDVPNVPVRGIATMIETDATGGSRPLATEITAWQNLWGSTYKAVGKALFSSKSGKKTLAYKTFTIKGGTDLGTEIGLRESDSLTLKITTAGAVTATLTYDTGKTKKDAKTKKTVKVYYRPTCSTVVIPTSAADAETFTGRVPLFLPSSAANNFPDLCVEVAYPFVAHGVPGPDGGSSWFTGEFNGYGDAQFPAGGDTEFLNGLFTINVASSLAFTGTFTGTDGSTAPFSGTFAKDGSSYVATGVSITVRGETMSMGLMCDPGPYAGSDEGFGEIGGGSEDVQGEPCIALNCAWQNIWKRSDLAAEWKPAFAAGTEKTIDLSETWLDGLVVGDSLTYAFGAEGAVSITGKIYGENVSVTAKLHLEGCDSSTDTMHCNVQFIANGHLYQQQFTFPRQATVAAADISLSASDFTRLD